MLEIRRLHVARVRCREQDHLSLRRESGDVGVEPNVNKQPDAVDGGINGASRNVIGVAIELQP